MTTDGGLRPLFQRKMPWVHWQPIETGATGVGTPDLNGAYSQRDVWIEMKATAHWAVKFQPAQVGWLMKRHRYGGSTWIAVRRAEKELWIVSGQWADRMALHGLRDIYTDGLYRYIAQGGERLWNWRRVSEEIFGHEGPEPGTMAPAVTDERGE